MTSLDIFDNITRLMRHLNIDDIQSGHDYVRDDNPLMRLIKNSDYLKNNKYVFVLSKRLSTSGNLLFLPDILAGLSFFNIKKDQYVILKYTDIYYRKFIPIQNKIYLQIDDILLYNAIGSSWAGLYCFIYNANGTEDLTQKLYQINVDFNTEFRRKLCGPVSMKIKDKVYSYVSGIMGTEYNGECLLYDKYNKSLKIIEKFLSLCYFRYKHGKKMHYVIDELEYMPDYGIKAKNIVSSLYERVHEMKQ